MFGEENCITVIVDNSKVPNSRWYTGSGIYRPVWLYVGKKEGIPYDGVKITTLSVSPAIIQVDVPREHAKVEIYEGDTLLVTGNPGRLRFQMRSFGARKNRIYIHAVCVSAMMMVEEKFGIREMKWSPQGFFINGQEVLLRGGCVHHDHGILGAVCY